ncbi:MAG: DUF262 domain-containing HNH endonuclease family protein [Bacteroidales bacterium]|nr:DUF262 domain-containing HNH endonuclease family protein [Lachnoclostridium sp.]MCM1385492.1 DUF262 domain-containing HNH endonuclease family protein [Lachnoclostridium sp.]MCM1466216.1 DUF262 domain-containing HNH endonuclease family protein [Bacteroidales bacterium]
MSEPKRTGLLQLLGNSLGCQFVIPVYQRNYTWAADKEVKQYFDDLKNVLRGDYKNHFMGIIIYLEKAIDFSSREFSIIDGQQRLTTTFLILYAIKQLLVNSHETERVQQLEGQYLTNPYHNDKIKYKLKPLVSDDDVYRCIVEDRMGDITDKDSNVLKNYQYISSSLNELLLEGYDANAVLMALDQLYVVCVPISEEDNAQKIFESINATGVKLTSADLIRNYLLMDLQSDVQEKYYIHYWKKLEENVSSDSKTLELFFRMYLAIKTYNLVPKNNVYREFVKWIEEQNILKQDLFEDLLEYAKIFKLLMREDIRQLEVPLKDSVVDFRKINSDLPMAIAMECYRLYRKNAIDVSTLAQLIDAVNVYMIRRSLCDMNSQNISKLFPAVLKKVMEKSAGDFTDIVKHLNQEMVGNNASTSGSYMPTDKQMMELLFRANVYKRPALRIVLDRLELNDNPAPVDLSMLSIEHLMPQTPTEEWLEELDTDVETYLENLHRLGNLTLAARKDNSKMSNLMWDYKNEVLKETAHLKLNLELMSIEKWDLAQIDRRTRELIEQICEIYPYPEVSITQKMDDNAMDEMTALDMCAKMAIEEENIICVRKKRAFKTKDNRKGYTIMSSKVYPQGDKEKYWFGYRNKRFEGIEDCGEQYVILGCRNQNLSVIKFPRKFIEQHLNMLNTSLDSDTGEVTHYHLVIFKNPDGKMTMLLSKPTLREIDISEYVVGNN